jgi:hypothetical protein
MILKKLIFSLCGLYCLQVTAATTITASFFNAHYDANNPLIAQETMIIELDADLPIAISGAPIQVAPPFDLNNDKIIFTGNAGHRVIVLNSIMWTFNFTMEFAGTAILQAQPAAIFNFSGGAINMNDYSQWLCVG